MIFALLLMAIEGLITWNVMDNIMKIVNEIPSIKLRYRVFKFLTSIPISFVMNFAISSLLTQFTGNGVTAGFANLGSSVIVAILLPFRLSRKYRVSDLEQEIKEARKKKRPSLLVVVKDKNKNKDKEISL